MHGFELTTRHPRATKDVVDERSDLLVDWDLDNARLGVALEDVVDKGHNHLQLHRREVTRDREDDVVHLLVGLGTGIGRACVIQLLEPCHDPLEPTTVLVHSRRIQAGVDGPDVIEDQLVALVLGLAIAFPQLDLAAEGGLELGEGGAVGVREHDSIRKIGCVLVWLVGLLIARGLGVFRVE